MCGIAGCVLPSGRRAEAATLHRMLAALGHRGPDDSGVQVLGNVGLAHARLAIVDPTPAGHQPMPDDGLWLTYNGELFNHLELRAELPPRAWRSGTDTETLLHALGTWGPSALARGNGLFAFGAYDARAGRLLLARDRFGVKPLYVARHDGGLFFASEIRALLAAGVPRRPRRDVLHHAVAYGWSEGADTPVEGVGRVAPGTLLSVDTTTLAVTEERWYDPAEVVDAERTAALAGADRATLKRELEIALRGSVRRRLMADVPLGAMCSGGIDSSLVAAFAREEQPGLVAFNASVTDQPAVDEGPWATKVARGLAIELRTVELDAASWRAGLIPAVVHNEHPLIHESSVPMAAIAALAHAGGVKVLLSGEGADELFGGYDGLHREAYAAFLPEGVRRRQRAATLLAQADALRRRRGANLLGGLQRRREPVVAGPAGTPAAAPSSVAWLDALTERTRTAYAHHPGARGDLEAALLGDLGAYLPHLLNRQDKNTMQHSVETRVPFLDPGVVALSLNLPLEVRAMPQRKGLLRDLAREHLPAGVASRQKLGFGFDVRPYLAGATQPAFLADGLLREALEVPAAEWRVEGMSSAQALRAWTGEIWCRSFLRGDDEDMVADALWR